ncbi:MAG: glycosyltransferase family 2 protein [Sphingomonadales bacterium]|nr:glycosyltransferase family 2 protein [Sphingomonadales bacterium]
MSLVSLLGVLALVPLALVDLVFCVETFLGLKPLPPSPLPGGPPPSIALLVPAHDEAPTLGAAHAMLAGLVAAGVRVVVVADNCRDETAAVAAAAGCEVVVRNDPLRRGKGHALAAGRDYLSADPPGIVVFLDADCTIDAGSLARLAARAAACDRVAQAANLLTPDPLAPPAIQISNFAFAVKNLLRQRGAARLGAAAILNGTGVAFPWPAIARLALATDNIVEDLALGIALVKCGQAPIFEEAARVWSPASTVSGTATQRARWEAGFVATARQFAWPLLRGGIARRDFRRFWLGAHLLVPALSLLMLANVAAGLLALGLASAAAARLPAAFAAILLAMMALAVIAAWLVEGRRHMPARSLLQIPRYLGWKLTLYLRLLSGRQAAAWIRTERAPQAASPDERR